MIRTLSLLLSAAFLLPAQQPTITNANLQTVTAAPGLPAALRATLAKQTTPAWIGYAVPRVSGDHPSCCWSYDGQRRGSGCGLEGPPTGRAGAPAGAILLEGSTHLTVLLRVEQGVVGKLQSYSLDCPLDAGGLPVYWFTNVRPAESVALLREYAERPPSASRRIARAAVQALAYHAGAEAEAALARYALSGATQELKKDASFWLANARGSQGAEVVRKVLREDPDERVREHAIFALTQSSAAGAIPAILQATKQDKSAHVRSKGLFWLAQKAAQQAIGPIAEAIEREPETEVKKKAVFALTQIPNGEGIPPLIRVAKENRNPAVRKQALFWLGQSKDPRALQYLEQVLTQ